jgi:hypothetical protein
VSTPCGKPDVHALQAIQNGGGQASCLFDTDPFRMGCSPIWTTGHVTCGTRSEQLFQNGAQCTLHCLYPLNDFYLAEVGVPLMSSANR